MAALAGTLQNPRLRAMIIPREHGAWGMLLVPRASVVSRVRSSFAKARRCGHPGSKPWRGERP